MLSLVNEISHIVLVNEVVRIAAATSLFFVLLQKNWRCRRTVERKNERQWKKMLNFQVDF